MVFYLFFLFAEGRKNTGNEGVPTNRPTKINECVIYNKKGAKEWEKFCVQFSNSTGTGSPAFGFWTRGRWLLSCGQFLGSCQVSASSQDQSFGWHAHPSLHIKNSLPPQALKIPSALEHDLLFSSSSSPGQLLDLEQAETRKKKNLFGGSWCTCGSPWNAQFTKRTKTFASSTMSSLLFSGRAWVWYFKFAFGGRWFG